ncbi:MAG: PadR family transcriptional regulator [Actinomycetota bacterium]|nr:PadR family transcriptional regulator [Actinomycetota bacterium]
MELSPTGRVILGFLAVEPKSGYDIKQLVDKSTRFFWAASYGQIYPDLKRLAASGLVEPADETTEGRRRITYRITAAGEEALGAWLQSPEQLHELRDEGLLKLFFAGLASDETAASILEHKLEAHREAIERLRAIKPKAAAVGRFGPLHVLEYGLALNEFSAEWCERTLNEVKRGK